MGYCMNQNNAKFHIKASDKPAAFKALKELLLSRPISWVNDVDDCKTLEALMEECRWELEVNETYDVTGINFSGEKAGDDQLIFNIIAPFVEVGSFIEMRGEDGTQWRWLFDGKTCTEKTATVSWD